MRLIDADALMEQLFSYYGCINPDATKSNYKGETMMAYEIVDMIQDCFDNAPTITPESLVRHGRWIVKEITSISPRGRMVHSRLFVCSQCGRSNGRTGRPYCPNCGTKMDMEE